jgi:hypothetical protein
MRAIATIAFGIAVCASTECQSGTPSWRAFAAEHKVMRWVGREFLVVNPYKYTDKIIAFQAWFVGSISETAIFSDRSGDLNQALSVQNVSSRSLKRGDPVVVAVRVSGPDKSENLSMVEIYRCSKPACSEFAKFNISGELVISEEPVHLLNKRMGDQNAGAGGRKEDD